jgi:hypothetical protein
MPTGPSPTGALNVLLTDAPTDDVQQVNIYFTGVTVKPVDGPVQRLDMTLPANPIDLLTLTDDVVTMAGGLVTAGTYEFMHLNIDITKSHIVESGVEKPLQFPSGEIKVVGGFTVPTNGVTTLTVDFDAEASLVLLGDGQWLLKPVVVITGNDTSS